MCLAVAPHLTLDLSLSRFQVSWTSDLTPLLSRFQVSWTPHLTPPPVPFSGQLDELAEVERNVHRRLTEMLRASERMSFSRREDKEITKLNELIKVPTVAGAG